MLKKYLTKEQVLYFVGFLLFFGWVWVTIVTYRADRMGFDSKTYWDWLELLLIPLGLTGATLWFAHEQKQTELEIAEKQREQDRKITEQEKQIDREIAEKDRKIEQEIAKDRQMQNTLELYFDKMTTLILEGKLPSTVDEISVPIDNGFDLTLDQQVIGIMRVRTFVVLRQLDSQRQRHVVLFLRDSRLLQLGVLNMDDLRSLGWSEDDIYFVMVE